MTQALATVDGGVDAAARGAPDALWVSMAEAGRRQDPPVSREAIRKRVARLEADGVLATRKGQRGEVLINIVAFDRAVRENTDPAQALRNRTMPVEEPDDVEDGAPDPEGGKAPSFHTARAEREAYQAENARLDLDDRRARFVDKVDAEHRSMTAFRRVRDRLLSLPAKVADQLAALPDARAMRAPLNAEMRRMLDHLAEELDHLGDDEDGAELDAGEGEERGPDQS